MSAGAGVLADAKSADTVDAHSPAVAALERTLVRAHPVPLAQVRIAAGPVKHAQDLDAEYLLSLNPDSMMAYYRIRAGLPQKAEPYAGWDGDGHNLTGHVAGHHLSAVSLMYEATGDPRFKARADYLVSEMKTVQDKNGDGYLCALSNGREAFGALHKGEIRAQPFDLNGMWSPWYTLHKTFAGLRDAYRHTGNATALDVETKFAAWAEGVIAPLSYEQVQHMLNTEQGGILEVMADLYADTGDARWLALSYRFEHHAFTDALKRGEDNLDGKHGNCQIPKLVGSAARYGYTADAGDLMAASFFWDIVVRHHTFASGGHGLEEYFGPADVLAAIVDGRTCESCNVYNMLKLTRRLFSFHPDPFLADFQERAIFNHVLSSIDPADGQMSYMVPVGRNEQQEYQNMLRSFTCCVGTGMENHALYGDGLYYETAGSAPSDDRIWVNLFIPSTAHFALGGVTLAMESSFPDGDTATIRLTMPQSRAFTLAVRRPSWAGDGFRIAVNGEDQPQPPLASLAAGAAGGRPVPVRSEVPPPST
ncbi:MAG: beta-L-arabinofuranosidase domain-containing protein, partial [Vicinamibacterales bacterium]